MSLHNYDMILTTSCLGLNISTIQERCDDHYFGLTSQRKDAPVEPISYPRKVSREDEMNDGYELLLSDERNLVQHVAFLVGDKESRGVTAVTIDRKKRREHSY